MNNGIDIDSLLHAGDLKASDFDVVSDTSGVVNDGKAIASDIASDNSRPADAIRNARLAYEERASEAGIIKMNIRVHESWRPRIDAMRERFKECYRSPEPSPVTVHKAHFTADIWHLAFFVAGAAAALLFLR